MEDIYKTEAIGSKLDEVLPTVVSNAITKAVTVQDKFENQCFKKIDDNKTHLDTQMADFKVKVYAEIENMKADNK